MSCHATNELLRNEWVTTHRELDGIVFCGYSVSLLSSELEDDKVSLEVSMAIGLLLPGVGVGPVGVAEAPVVDWSFPFGFIFLKSGRGGNGVVSGPASSDLISSRMAPIMPWLVHLVVSRQFSLWIVMPHPHTVSLVHSAIRLPLVLLSRR